MSARAVENLHHANRLAVVAAQRDRHHRLGMITGFVIDITIPIGRFAHMARQIGNAGAINAAIDALRDRRFHADDVRFHGVSKNQRVFVRFVHLHGANFRFQNFQRDMKHFAQNVVQRRKRIQRLVHKPNGIDLPLAVA